MYENFNLKEWPFRTTADENFASIWAGREKTHDQINYLLRKITLIPKSGLHILWANFGMGKTHTLYHLSYRCNNSKDTPQIIPVYAVLPKRSTGFLELYREIVQGLPYEYLRKQLQKIGNNLSGSVALHPMFQRSPGVVKALLSMNPDDIEASTTARQWIAAKPGLTTSDLSLIKVTYRIKTPEDAINALSALTNLACYNQDPQKANRLLVMIDEYQRVGELKPRIAAENHSSLHTYFNQHPTSLQLVLSFSFGKKENVDYMLSPELKSRTDPQAINLDVLTKFEAVEFICDLFSQFRIEPDERWSFPFTANSVDRIIQVISSNKALTPRRLMIYFDYVLSHCLMDDLSIGDGLEYEQFSSYLNDPELGSLDIDIPS